MTSNYKHLFSDTELLDTDATNLPEMPLAREHSTQKHSYPLNKGNRSGVLPIKEIRSSLRLKMLKIVW